jgi:hypothetical protein
VWPQGVEVDRPKETPPVPEGFNWDKWIGPAPMRPYHPTYHPNRWRAWCDFGTGSLGDLGCHILDAASPPPAPPSAARRSGNRALSAAWR